MINILTKDPNEAIQYFKNKLSISEKGLYITLINFELLRDKNSKFAERLYDLYKADPYL